MQMESIPQREHLKKSQASKKNGPQKKPYIV